MDEPSRKPIDYDGRFTFKQLPDRRWEVLTIVLILAALFVSTFLPIWPASNMNGRWHTSLWKSDLFVIYD